MILKEVPSLLQVPIIVILAVALVLAAVFCVYQMMLDHNPYLKQDKRSALRLKNMPTWKKSALRKKPVNSYIRLMNLNRKSVDILETQGRTTKDIDMLVSEPLETMTTPVEPPSFEDFLNNHIKPDNLASYSEFMTAMQRLYDVSLYVHKDSQLQNNIINDNLYILEKSGT